MLVLVKNLKRSNKIEDLVFWYLARLDPQFRMGATRRGLRLPNTWTTNPEEQRRNEELVKQKVQEALDAKQPLHQVVRCDSHGRPMDPDMPTRKKKKKKKRKEKKK